MLTSFTGGDSPGASRVGMVSNRPPTAGTCALKPGAAQVHELTRHTQPAGGRPFRGCRDEARHTEARTKDGTSSPQPPTLNTHTHYRGRPWLPLNTAHWRHISRAAHAHRLDFTPSVFGNDFVLPLGPGICQQESARSQARGIWPHTAFEETRTSVAHSQADPGSRWRLSYSMKHDRVPPTWRAAATGACQNMHSAYSST
jgi:hypothetical protein